MPFDSGKKLVASKRGLLFFTPHPPTPGGFDPLDTSANFAGLDSSVDEKTEGRQSCVCLSRVCFLCVGCGGRAWDTRFVFAFMSCGL